MRAVFLFCLLFAALVVAHSVEQHDDVPVTQRIDCYPESGASQQACQARGCLWGALPGGNTANEPYCYYPAYTGYSVSGQLTDNPLHIVKRQGSPPCPYGSDISPLTISTQYIGKTLNVKIGVNGRYEPPLGLPRKPSISSETLQFVPTQDSNNFFSFSVQRQSNQAKLVDTSVGGFLFSDQFIQFATLLPSTAVYGWGENSHRHLIRDFTVYNTWSMFARDQPPSPGSHQNLYGVHPFHIAVESDGKAHGLLILNSNAADVTFGPAPHLYYRTLGGIIDLYVFPGPRPEDVVNQYMALIGTPFLPAYWAMGFQLCRYGFTGTAAVKTVVDRTRAAGIPLDVQYVDVDYMDHRKDFTLGATFSDLGTYAQQLHSMGMHVTLLFDPAIQVDYDVFSRGKQMGAQWVMWPPGTQIPHVDQLNDRYPLTKGTLIMLGVVWPDNNVAFPDFLDSSNATTAWWANEFRLFRHTMPFDGIWIDMNEPSVFGTNDNNPWYFNQPDHANTPPLFCPEPADSLDNPPYHPGVGDRLYDKTLCMRGTQNNNQYQMYNTHNLYGWGEARATVAAMQAATPGKRGMIVSRSTFVSSGRYAGHWLGDNSANWDTLAASVVGAMEFNYFGITYVGSDICGFLGHPDAELCARWQQMGAFHTFSRNHNDKSAPDQDPATMGSVVIAATKQALLFRYNYLPHLYSLMYDAHINGHTVLRPLFFEFPADPMARKVETQFLWGSSFMISPVLTQGAQDVSVYFPNDIWYRVCPALAIADIQCFQSGLAETTQATTKTIGATLFQMIPVHIRGGAIVPRQGITKFDGTTVLTTVELRQNPFELLVALNAQNAANGMMYWDDGESILPDSNPSSVYYKWTFNYTETSTMGQLSLQIVNKPSQAITVPKLNIIDVLGYTHTADFNSFKLDGRSVQINTQLSSNNVFRKHLIINTPNLIDLTALHTAQQSPSLLTWNHQ